MTTKITRDILEGYLNCMTKGHLKLAGEQGTRSDYEAMRLDARDAVRLWAVEKILGRQPENEVAQNTPLTRSALKAGALFVANAVVEDEFACLEIDGLKKVEGPSKLGDFHYVPVLYHEAEKVRQEQRLLLEVLGLYLSRVQGRMPGHGVVWHGKDCRPAKVRLDPDPQRAEQILRDFQQIRDGKPP